MFAQKPSTTPNYRLHKSSGQAVVTLEGRDIYLGPHGTPESRQEYERVIAEWLGNGRCLPASLRGGDLTMTELMLAYIRHGKTYYVKNGEFTSEVASIKLALKPVKELYANASARAFGPLALKAVRQAMIRRDWCRRYINHNVDRVRRMFRWGVENELVPASTYEALRAVSGLRRGRCEARESQRVLPVPDAHIVAVLKHVSPQVAAMIEMQLLTGMRPGEIVTMRTCDLDMTGKCWSYRPASHKTEHHEKERVIHIGPRAQQVLRTFLRTTTTACLFSPQDAEKLRRERLSGMRVAETRRGVQASRRRSDPCLHRPAVTSTTGLLCHVARQLRCGRRSRPNKPRDLAAFPSEPGVLITGSGSARAGEEHRRRPSAARRLDLYLAHRRCCTVFS